MLIVKPDKAGIELAVKYLKAGKNVVYPTDTAYGLAVDATNAAAVRRLYSIKGRDFKKPVHVVVGSLAQAKKLVFFNRLAERLFRKFLPGALTLVLSLRPPLNLPPMRGRDSGSRRHRVETLKALRMLSAGTETLGIRMPDNSIALFLVKKLRWPITATSANVSGHGAPYSIEEIVRQFSRSKIKPDLILDSGKLPKVRPSTLVDLTSERVTILRTGPVSKQEILKTCTD